MEEINNFFSLKNTVNSVSDEEVLQTNDYLEPIKAFARTTYNSIYVIDYQKKGFDYVSENPLFLCGHTGEEVQEMGYAFYFKYVLKQDLDLLLKINGIGFEFYEKIPVEERKFHTISYDFHLKNQEGKIIVSDRLSAYDELQKKSGCDHQICWAHLLRNSKDLAEHYPEAKYIHKRMKFIFRKAKKGEETWQLQRLKKMS